MTIGSLFIGIGGLELGLERAGLGPVRWQVEQDPFCRRVLAHHWPKAERFEDVREVGENLVPVDLICGGFPCQDISIAGKGEGLDGERSGLWREYARIVRLARPRFVVVENVSALLGRGLGDVLGDLASCGYDAIWDCIPASSVGAPHQRDRLFVVAWMADASGGRGWESWEKNRKPRWPDRPCKGGQQLADTGSKRRQEPIRHAEPDGQEEPGPCGYRWPPLPGDLQAWRTVPSDAQPSFCRVANGLSARLDWAVGTDRSRALKAYGNAVVPAVAEAVGRVVNQLKTAQEAR